MVLGELAIPPRPDSYETLVLVTFRSSTPVLAEIQRVLAAEGQEAAFRAIAQLAGGMSERETCLLAVANCRIVFPRNPAAQDDFFDWQTGGFFWIDVGALDSQAFHQLVAWRSWRRKMILTMAVLGVVVLGSGTANNNLAEMVKGPLKSVSVVLIDRQTKDNENDRAREREQDRLGRSSFTTLARAADGQLHLETWQIDLLADSDTAPWGQPPGEA